MQISPELVPAKIVEELDKYIIGQLDAKRAVAIALRNRWRRQQTPEALQNEIMPNNIILIGPTGVGKTEIARRLARLANAPFIKVEASKYTEVGYVGRDVESMVRELMNNSVNQIRQQMFQDCEERATALAINKVLDILVHGASGKANANLKSAEATRRQTLRDKLREKLLAGKLDDKEIEFKPEHNELELQPGISLEMFDFDVSEVMASIFPGPMKTKRMRMTVAHAVEYFTQREAERLVPKEKVLEEAKNAVENRGIIFIDELDKIAAVEKGGGIDVSRSGVQRDLLPIVEGSQVPTKYGPIDTSHILFVAAGAFHTAKPSDLIPELQGRFPLRVELHSLDQNDFERILLEPENSLVKQYTALFAAEGSKLSFTKPAIREIARYAALANSRLEDIGARRLHTIMNSLLEEELFDLPDPKLARVRITDPRVREKLLPVLENEDLSRFIL
jgi:ATP-dependent HslUV protease ATP-binding subunit HslU